MAKRPRYQRKSDALLHGNSDPWDIRCDMAVAPFDEKAREMEKKWGIDRLPGLVPVEMAERYGSALAKLNAAIAANSPEETAARAAVCIRGLDAMDRAATEAGAQPADPDVWEFDLDGWRVGIYRDGREWQAAQEARPDLALFNLREVAVALQAMRDSAGLLEAAKRIPGAQVTAVRKHNPHTGEIVDDEINF